MKIEILGTGCAKCKKMEELVRDVVKEQNVEAQIVKVTQINEIMNYGVMFTPALVIDGEVKVAGKIPLKEEIIKWIKK